MKSSQRAALWFLLPSFCFVALFSLFPIVESLRLSFYRTILTLPWLGQRMVGWENYADLVTDPVARDALVTTLLFIGVTIPLELLLGLGIALVLNEAFRGRGLLRAVVLIPWAIPTVVASQMWRFIFNDRYGLVNFMLFGADTSSYMAPLADPHLALTAIMIAEIWKTTPFAALILLAGLQSIPDEVYEAANVDGATAGRNSAISHCRCSSRRCFWRCCFAPSILYACSISSIVMTQGGPADATNMLQFYGYKKTFTEGMIGYGSAIAVTMFLISLTLALVYLQAFRTTPFERGRPVKRTIALALFSGGIALYCLVPFVWFVLTSLKSGAELTAIPPILLPSFHLSFYRSALENYGLLHYIVNSIIVAGSATLVTVAVGSLAAYAVARFQLKWTNFYLLLLLAISMFPQIAIAGPVWTILDRLRWLNTYQGLVAAYVSLCLPLATWILATFFRDVPAEIEEAALIDGCSRLQALYKVVQIGRSLAISRQAGSA